MQRGVVAAKVGAYGASLAAQLERALLVPAAAGSPIGPGADRRRLARRRGGGSMMSILGYTGYNPV